MARYALEHSDLKRMTAYVIPANAGSVRVAEGLGMRYQLKVNYLDFFADPSVVELEDPIASMYAVDRAGVTLRDGPYRVVDAEQS